MVLSTDARVGALAAHMALIPFPPLPMMASRVRSDELSTIHDGYAVVSVHDFTAALLGEMFLLDDIREPYRRYTALMDEIDSRILAFEIKQHTASDVYAMLCCVARAFVGGVASILQRGPPCQDLRFMDFHWACVNFQGTIRDNALRHLRQLEEMCDGVDGEPVVSSDCFTQYVLRFIRVYHRVASGKN